jgi:glutaminyl-tRNA synthetase
MEPAKSKKPAPVGASASAGNFVRELIAADRAAGLHGGRVATRFPPEPNGYLHIGHAKAICVDFGLAREFGGTCNLRFDDTNPATEDVEYVEAIQDDIRWLGFEWSQLFYASDYFEQLYELAVKLIKKGKAYVDSLNEEEIREYRGDFYKKGRPSPFRSRSVEENLDLFARMRAGEFPEGKHVLRAIIDLETQNMNLRDPVLYRVRYAPITARGPGGASIRCTTSRIPCRMRSRPSRTPSAPWSSNRTGRSTTGASARPRCSRRGRSSSPG